jgi:hypothetical protein
VQVRSAINDTTIFYPHKAKALSKSRAVFKVSTGPIGQKSYQNKDNANFNKD